MHRLLSKAFRRRDSRLARPLRRNTIHPLRPTRPTIPLHLRRRPDSSFLRSAATTAAGVAAGALAFEGVESLLHGFGHGGGGGFGDGFSGVGVGNRPEETVINNYYDEPNPNQNFGGEERGGREASFNDGGGRESSLEDRGDHFANNDNGAQFNDASYDPGTSQDLGSFDDQSSGDFDDGGGFDSGDDSNVV